MKITKMVRTVTTLALLAMTAISVYSSVKAKEAYDEMKTSCDVLRGRLSDMRVTVNSLSEQIKTHKAQLELVMNSEKECIADVSEETECGSEYSEGENTENPESDVFYTVREYNGMIGIFDVEGELLREENIMVASLSAADRQSLELGIRVDSEEELAKLIEDLK